MAQKKIPIEARREIYALLSDQLQVKASDVTAVLKKYGVTGDAERLQERYRRRLAQSLMSALRDEQGRREVFAVVNASGDVLYVPIEYCNSRAELKQIRQRMRRQMRRKHKANIACNIGFVHGVTVAESQLAFWFSCHDDGISALYALWRVYHTRPNQTFPMFDSYHRMIGLDLSSGKVDDRLHDLDQFANRLKGGR